MTYWRKRCRELGTNPEEASLAGERKPDVAELVSPLPQKLADLEQELFRLKSRVTQLEGQTLWTRLWSKIRKGG